MEPMVELKPITFENLDRVLKLSPGEDQRHFVEPAYMTIALGYAGISEGYPGFVSAIYSGDEPVGIILIGRAPVGEGEPDVLQRYEYVYRLMGFFIDERHQRRGIGKRALELALLKLGEFEDGARWPLTLECKKDNLHAAQFYRAFGFVNTGTVYDGEDEVLVRMDRVEG